MKQRAAEMADTHLRITEAAIELHGTVGPARTTLSAVAKRAGVERRTLYRHVPNEADLSRPVRRTTSPPIRSPIWTPGAPLATRPSGWSEPSTSSTPTTNATAPMLANVLRDAELVDFARDAVAPLRAYLDDAAEVLLGGRRGRLLAAAVRHALAFSTWRSLSGIRRSDALKLVTALVRSAG